MGLAAKLNVAFITVILIMVMVNTGYQLFVEFNDARSAASKQVQLAHNKIDKEFGAILRGNQRMVAALTSNSQLQSAWAARDRTGTANAIQSVVNHFGFPGCVTIIDREGKVFYSTDTPKKFGYSVKGQLPELEHILVHKKEDTYTGYAVPTLAGTVCIGNLMRMPSGDAIIAASQPLNTQFLTGLQRKLELLDNQLRDIQLVTYSADNRRVEDITPGLQKSDGGYVARLNKDSSAVPKLGQPYEANGRMWIAVPIRRAEGNRVAAAVLATAPIANVLPKMAIIAGQGAVSAACALLLSMLFTAGIAGRFNSSLRFIMNRAKDLAANKQSLPSLDGLSGEWLELAEIIDTAVASPRSSIQSLRGQISKYMEEMEEKSQQVEAAQNQVEQSNKQLMMQKRQLSELSQQMNYASQQTVLLQQKLASVLQVSTEGFLILDQFGNVLTANPVFLNWTGVSESEIAGRFCFDLVRKPGEPPDNNGSSASFAHPGGRATDLIEQFYPEGVVYHQYQSKETEVLAHLHPIVMDGSGIQGYVMVLRDKSLHAEVARIRSDVTTLLSEQIRAQLVTAQQRWAPILNNSSASLHPSVGQALAELHGQYQQLLGMVDSYVMLYGGFVPAQTTPREQVSITRLVGECLEQVMQTARQHQVLLDYKTVTGLPTTAVDGDLVRTVIVQLLEKMISVTAPGGRVRVESIHKGNEIRISITSSGPAVAQEEIEDMFAGFIEGKHQEDSYGSRLALYLARNNIERMGGRVWAESEAGRGTTIFCALPVH